MKNGSSAMCDYFNVEVSSVLAVQHAPRQAQCGASAC